MPLLSIGYKQEIRPPVEILAYIRACLYHLTNVPLTGVAIKKPKLTII